MSESNKDIAEQSFNDDELQDIMNEIESLEQDFSDDSDSQDEEVLGESEAGDLHVDIDADVNTPEMEVSSEEGEDDVEVDNVEIHTQEDNHVEDIEVVEVDSHTVEDAEVQTSEGDGHVEEEHSVLETEEHIISEDGSHHVEEENVVSLNSQSHGEHTSSNSPMGFSVNGSMDLNLSFETNGGKAFLNLCKGGQLMLKMEGLIFSIGNTGWAVEMSDGAKFTTPFTNKKHVKNAS